MSQELNTYRGRRVLVTGHTGFKGSWLSIWLKVLGAEVIGYALDPYTNRDNFVLCGLKDQVFDTRSDIRSFESLHKVFAEYQPEFVFHLAAQSLVRKSYDHPKDTFDVNVGGTINVLECCRLSKSVQTAIVVTSDKCYQNREWIWGYRETDELGGHDAYSSSKACAELAVDSYRRAFFQSPHLDSPAKAVSSVRAGNVIGGGDWREDRIVPDCIRSLETGEPILIRNPGAIRPWQFVLEPLGGYLLLGAKMFEDRRTYSGAWNFGPEFNAQVTVQELVAKVVDEFGKGSWRHDQNQDQAGDFKRESVHLALDISKAKSVLGWRPKLGLDEAIHQTVAWYLQSRDCADMFEFCSRQIRHYMERPTE